MLALAENWSSVRSISGRCLCVSTLYAFDRFIDCTELECLRCPPACAGDAGHGIDNDARWVDESCVEEWGKWNDPRRRVAPRRRDPIARCDLVGEQFGQPICPIGQAPRDADARARTLRHISLVYRAGSHYRDQRSWIHRRRVASLVHRRCPCGSAMNTRSVAPDPVHAEGFKVAISAASDGDAPRRGMYRHGCEHQETTPRMLG